MRMGNRDESEKILLMGRINKDKRWAVVLAKELQVPVSQGYLL